MWHTQCTKQLTNFFEHRTPQSNVFADVVMEQVVVFRVQPPSDHSPGNTIRTTRHVGQGQVTQRDEVGSPCTHCTGPSTSRWRRLIWGTNSPSPVFCAVKPSRSVSTIAIGSTLCGATAATNFSEVCKPAQQKNQSMKQTSAEALSRVEHALNSAPVSRCCMTVRTAPLQSSSFDLTRSDDGAQVTGLVHSDGYFGTIALVRYQLCQRSSTTVFASSDQSGVEHEWCH